KACICGNKFSQFKNKKSCFCLAILITCCRAAFSQSLHYTVFNQLTFGISSKNGKI
ncbi:hypothetical protein HMPREF1362_02061, partial [Enterococcus faecium ERV102]